MVYRLNIIIVIVGDRDKKADVGAGATTEFQFVSIAISTLS